MAISNTISMCSISIIVTCNTACSSTILIVMAIISAAIYLFTAVSVF